MIGVPRIRPDRTILSVAGAARRAADRLHAPRFGPPGARHGRSWAKNVLMRPAARAPEGPSAPWCALVRARAAVSTQLRSPTAPSARCSPRPEAAASLRAWVGNFVATSGDSCWPLTDPLVVCLALRGGTSRGGITAGPSLGTSQPNERLSLVGGTMREVRSPGVCEAAGRPSAACSRCARRTRSPTHRRRSSAARRPGRRCRPTLPEGLDRPVEPL